MPKLGVRLDGQVLEALVLRKRTSWNEVADDLGITATRLAKIKAGREGVSMDVLVKIESYFGVKAEDSGLIAEVDRSRFELPAPRR